MAIDGKTLWRSHDRGAGAAPLHLVSAFATIARPVLAQEAVPDKASALAAIPPLLARLGAEDGLERFPADVNREGIERSRCAALGQLRVRCS